MKTWHVRRRLNGTTASDAGAGYSPFADVNGDARINALDAAAVRQRLNTRLPDGEPPPQAHPESASAVFTAAAGAELSVAPATRLLLESVASPVA